MLWTVKKLLFVFGLSYFLFLSLFLNRSFLCLYDQNGQLSNVACLK